MPVIYTIFYNKYYERILYYILLKLSYKSKSDAMLVL